MFIRQFFEFAKFLFSNNAPLLSHTSATSQDGTSAFFLGKLLLTFYELAKSANGTRSTLLSTIISRRNSTLPWKNLGETRWASKSTSSDLSSETSRSAALMLTLSSDLLLGSVGSSFVANPAISVSRWLGARWNSPIIFASCSRNGPTCHRSRPTSGSTFFITTCSAQCSESRPTFTQISCSRSSLQLLKFLSESFKRKIQKFSQISKSTMIQKFSARNYFDQKIGQKP